MDSTTSSLYENPTAIKVLIAEMDRLQAERDALLRRIMTKTRLCPFGGGKDGERKECRFGHPGCACMDWFTAYEEKQETRAADTSPPARSTG